METSTPNKMATIYVVEDHPLMQRAYRMLFEREADLTVCGVTDMAEAALQEIPTLQPDITLIDVSLKGSAMDGIQLVKRLLMTAPDLRILVISGYDDALMLAEARAAGAKGYVAKSAVGTFLTAVRTILAGKTFFFHQGSAK